MDNDKLQQFYAVTVSLTSVSVYEVRGQMEGSIGYPVAEKIRLRGESKAPIGHKTGSSMIAICKWLIPFVPEGGGVTTYQRDIASVNTSYWGVSTSPISALFLNEADALKCFQEEKHLPCDPRWLNETKAVLLAIGDENPSFSVCRAEGLNLMEDLASK